MKFLLIIILIILTSCSKNKVINNHGVLSLETKYNKIFLNKTNKNEIFEILGPPSTKSKFDENLWFYIERKKTNQSIIKLGGKKIEKNNVLILELNNKGVLVKKKLQDLNKMNKVVFSEATTEKEYSKNSYIYDVLTSLREKINAPTRKRIKK